MKTLIDNYNTNTRRKH